MSKTLTYCLCAVLLFSGCGVPQKKEKTRIVNANKKSKSRLIMPSKELSALSEQSDSCAFILPAQSKKSKQLSIKEQIQQVEARLVDVPIPVSVRPAAISHDDRGYKLLSYESSLPSAEIKKFYIQEMERFGWRQEYYFEGQELLLSFKKPDRFCSISVRPTRASWDRSKNVLLNIFVS
ncbi:MAG: hypothetical protein ACJAZS_000704 [Alteromonas naphthalenivorans]|jgi:hypothetical protein